MNTTFSPAWGEATAVTASPVALLLFLPLLTLLLSYVVPWVTSPLRGFPGPAIASWTNLWRMHHAYDGSMHSTTLEMHKKYGPVVRMAPNYLDLDYDTCGSLIKTCFDTKGVWKKTQWHAVSGFKVGNDTRYNIFSEVRPAEHSRMKKPVSKYWTTSAVARMEPHLDSVIALFTKQLQDRFASHGGGLEMGNAFDFGEWAMFFSWDAIAQTTMSRRIGYLEHGHDFDGTLATSEKASRYLVTVGMYPVLDKFLDKNPVCPVGPPSYSNLASLAVKLLTDRLTGQDGHDAAKDTDFMDQYIEAQKQHPDIVDNAMLVSYVLVNLAAGADTSAAALRTILYLCLGTPGVWARLSEAVLAAPFAQPGRVQLPAPYAQARAIPYLEAVVREALRLYPGNLFPQERVVPAGGLRLPDGRVVPEGTAVGFNAYALHRNRATWGPDADEFRPERFLRGPGEPEAVFRSRMRLFGDGDLSFGAGSRRCIGANLAMMEVYKTVATLVASFDFVLAGAGGWAVRAELFPRATGIVCRIRRRPGMSPADEMG